MPLFQRDEEECLTEWWVWLTRGIEIDKALFDYRYRRQTQLHQRGAGMSMNANAYTYENNMGMNKCKNKFSGGQRRKNNNNNSNVGAGSHRRVQAVPQQPVSPAMAQQQQQQGYALMGQKHVANTAAMQQGGAFHHQYVTAGSPDLFMPEGVITPTMSNNSNNNKFDAFSLNLSSSISSGSSSFSSSNGEVDHIIGGSGFANTNPTFGSIWDPIVSQQEKPSQHARYVGFNETTNATNATNVVNEQKSFGSRTTGEKTNGWLNIWGNDMSVWGWKTSVYALEQGEYQINSTRNW